MHEAMAAYNRASRRAAARAASTERFARLVRGPYAKRMAVIAPPDSRRRSALLRFETAIAISALIAWLVSLPVSGWAHSQVEGRIPDWTFHWFVTLPTVVLLPGLLLWVVKSKPSSATSGRAVTEVVGVCLAAPVLLGGAIATNVITLGTGLPILAALLLTKRSASVQDVQSTSMAGHTS